MKTLKISLLTTSVALAFSANAADITFKAGDNTLDTRICMDAATNNLSAYRRHVGKMMGVSRMKAARYQLVANKLRCNNEHIVHFAQRYGADETAAFINRFVDKKVIIRKVTETSKDADNLKEDKAKIILVTSNSQ